MVTFNSFNDINSRLTTKTNYITFNALYYSFNPI